MATYYTHVQNSRIVSGGGPVTRQRYSGDNAQTWKAGQLVKLSSGVITEVVDNGSGVEIDTDDLADGSVLFIANEAVAAATDGKVEVQRILSSTILEGPMLSGSDTAPPTVPESIIGVDYAIYQGTSGYFAPDKNDEVNPVITIVDVEGNFKPWKSADMNKDSSGEQYHFVRFKFDGVSDV